MNKIIHEQMDALKTLCKRYKVKSLYAFGSINTPRFTDKSDIDLLIDFELFKRKIDLVTRRSLSNPFFIEDVEQSKQLLYG